MRTKTLFILTTLLALTISAAAQRVSRKDYRENTALRQAINTKFNSLYVQNSEIGYLTGPFMQLGADRLYLLTGAIVPHYYVFPQHWRTGFIITPAVRIRIIKGFSAPVRTPSYTPGGTFYLKLNRDTTRYKYLSIGIFHHSNGQDGTPLNPDGSINTYNGNFGTNYVELSLNFGRQSKEHNRYFKFGVEAHTGLIEKYDEPAFRGLYPNLRFNYKISGSDYINKFTTMINKQAFDIPALETEELWRTIFEGMVVLDSELDLEWYRKFNVELKLYRKIRNSPNTSWFFSMGYLGHDYYNVYFMENYPIIRFGLAAGNSFFNQRQAKPE